MATGDLNEACLSIYGNFLAFCKTNELPLPLEIGEGKIDFHQFIELLFIGGIIEHTSRIVRVGSLADNDAFLEAVKEDVQIFSPLLDWDNEKKALFSSRVTTANLSRLRELYTFLQFFCDMTAILNATPIQMVGCLAQEK